MNSASRGERLGHSVQFDVAQSFPPHNAFTSEEALQRILDTTVENIRAFRSGAPVNTDSV